MSLPVFMGAFESVEDVTREFHVASIGGTLLFARYDLEPYEGAAMVLFEKEGVLYEVNGGHCSCHGLEDQWKPERTTVDALAMRAQWSLDSAPKEALEEIRVYLAWGANNA